jgi:hypothetical protein
MTFANPGTILLLASAPALLLIATGVVPWGQKKVHSAIRATALAMGIACLVLQLFVIGVHSLDILAGFADSWLMTAGLPLATFFISLDFLSRRRGLSLASAASCGVIGIAGLWYLGGAVVMLTACGMSSSGGC